MIRRVIASLLDFVDPFIGYKSSVFAAECKNQLETEQNNSVNWVNVELSFRFCATKMHQTLIGPFVSRFLSFSIPFVLLSVANWNVFSAFLPTEHIIISQFVPFKQ